MSPAATSSRSSLLNCTASTLRRGGQGSCQISTQSISVVAGRGDTPVVPEALSPNLPGRTLPGYSLEANCWTNLVTPLSICG